MSLKIDFISAETHTPEYLMHKYWARKPHNVIKKCIEELTDVDDVIIDPFCGSGVVLREGALLARKCYGFDLNPSAYLISKTLVSNVDSNSFSKAFCEIYENVKEKYGYLYQTHNGDTIKYVSHRIVSRCECGNSVHVSDCEKKGKNYYCPKCHGIIRFNLEHLVDTDVFNIETEKGKNEIIDEDYIKQKEFSKFLDNSVSFELYNYTFPENRRILAFAGIKTKDFFTNRNFTILCAFADEIWKISDNNIRDYLLLLLTASSAQCSRLIAHRNNMSTGGPAWSIPGFWIPQEHLETNPFVHIYARYKKILKAIEYIKLKPCKTEVCLKNGNSLEILKSDDYKNLKAKMIFLDPPYGDSVPYTEFSNVWNSFLRQIPNSNDDISVSDRLPKEESWNNYSRMLNDYMKEFTNHLTDNGKLLITFNNNDMRAWDALISSLQNNGFVCEHVFYQIPAVISSKAQKSIDTSYISDVYSVYRYAPNIPQKQTTDCVSDRLIFIANARNGIVSRPIIDREFIISWLQNNVSNQLLPNKEDIISSIFDYDKEKKCYILKPEHKKDVKILKDLVIDTLNSELNKLISIDIMDAYKMINSKLSEYGTIELGEFKAFISSFDISDNKIRKKQICLFDL